MGAGVVPVGGGGGGGGGGSTDAADIDIVDTGTYFTGTDVEAALQEVGATLAAVPELARDALGTALTAGAGIVVTTDDAGNTITLSSDAAGFAVYSAGWPARPSFDTVIWSSTDRAATAPGAATGTDIVLLPSPLEVWEFALSDETTAITTGTAKLSWRTPAAITLTGVRASLATVSSSGIPTVNIKENGTTIFSTKLTIDASELTSTTAAAAAVLSDTSLADDALITFDIDVAGTGAKGLKVKLYGYRS